MRNHPSIVYLHDHPVISNIERNDEIDYKTVTLAMKVVQGPEEQHLVAAIAVPHPDECLVTQTMDTQNGLDSFPVELEVPRNKFPFVKSQGRDLVLSRLEEAITKLQEGRTNFRGPGYVCVSNTNQNICQSGYYMLLKRFVHVPEGDVVPFLDMAKPLVTKLALDLFTHEGHRFEAWMGTSLDHNSDHATIDLHTSFRRVDL